MNRHLTIILITLALTFNIDTATSQTKRALLIGISHYSQQKPTYPGEPWDDIHGVNDITLLAPILKNQGFEVSTLMDKKATAATIRAALSTLVKNTQKGDILYLHFSCHGQPVEDLDGDEADGWDEALVPIDAGKTYVKGIYEGEHHILDDELHEVLASLQHKTSTKGIVYVIIDACHAGTSYRDDNDSTTVRGTGIGFSANGKAYHPQVDKRARIKVGKLNGMSDICLVEACRSYQANNEIIESGIHYGALSYHVCQVLVSTRISKNTAWIHRVKQMMKSDKRLIGQDIVIESSR